MVAPSSAISANTADGGEAASEDLPTKKLDNDQLLARIKGWWKDDDACAQKWRELAKIDFAFEAGHQWNDADREKLRTEGRPVIKFNVVRPLLKAVRGLEINSREETTFKPRSDGDEPVAECATSLMEWARDEADVEDEETDAFRDVLIGGMGWIEQRIDDIDEPQYIAERVDPWEMRWDASARKRNLADAKRVHRVKEVALDDARAMFPGVDDLMLDAAWARGAESGSPIDRERARDYEADSGKGRDEIRERGRVTMVETQWSETCAYRTLTWQPPPDPMAALTGTPPTPPQTEEMLEDDALTAAERYQMIGMQAQLGQPTYRRVVYRAIIGAEILETGELPIQGEGFTYKPITGEWDREERVFSGMVRDAIDPQEWLNKWVSQIQYRLNQAAKKQTWFEADAFVDQAKAEKDLTKTGALIEFNEGALTNGKVQRMDEAEMPDSTERLLQFAMEIMPRVTGLNAEIMGFATNDQPGILEHQRKQASITILADYFDNLRRFRKASARMAMKMLIELMPVEVLARAVGREFTTPLPPKPDEPASQPMSALEMLIAPGAPRYDLVIEESPTSANAKERAWAAISPLLPVLIEQASPPILAAIVEASPLPNALAQKIAAELTKQPDPEQQQKQQAQEALAMAGAQAQVQETQASAFQKQTAGQLNLAKVQGEAADAQAAIIEASTPDIVMQRLPPNGVVRPN